MIKRVGQAKQHRGGSQPGNPHTHPPARPPTVCDAQPILEHRLNAQLGEPGVDFGAPSVDHDWVDAHTGQQHQVRHHPRLQWRNSMVKGAGSRAVLVCVSSTPAVWGVCMVAPLRDALRLCLHVCVHHCAMHTAL